MGMPLSQSLIMIMVSTQRVTQIHLRLTKLIMSRLYFLLFVPDVTPVYQQIQYFVNEDDVNFEICVAIVSPSANMLSAAGTVEVTFESGGSASMSCY